MVLTYLHVLDPEIPDVLQSMGIFAKQLFQSIRWYIDQCWPCVGHEKPLLLGFLADLHAYMTRYDPICHDLMAHNMGRIQQFYQQTQVWKCLSLGTSQWYDCPTPFRMMFSPDLPHPPTSSSTLRIVHVSWFFEDSSLPPTHGMVDLLAGPCTQSGCPSLHYLYYGFMYINYIYIYIYHIRNIYLLYIIFIIVQYIYIICARNHMRKESFMMLAWPYPKLCWMHGLGKVLSYGHRDRPTATSAGKKDP